ncbi:YihY/virulence factor BrkB family protein [Allohahella marinimesophila]|uniref:YihY/virulence factor BrkB family protein n=1 Tax=Allohahella marinimesophila TaxID=1054972 RepID=A0ABP7NGH4_9GAMM
MATQHASSDHGRQATSPGDIPKSGWKDILIRTWKEKANDNLGLVAAGVAFYFLLAVFPAIGAFISIYGLMYDPADAQQQMSDAMTMMPADAREILNEQMQQLAQRGSGTLGLSAAIGILLAIWSSMKGTSALMTALNIVYDEREERGFVYLKFITFLITFGAFVFVAVSLVVIAAAPAILEQMGLGSWIETVIQYARWPVLALLFMSLLAVLYRFGPSRAAPKWRWVSLGSVTGTILWIVGSLLFSWYASNFGSYNETFGSLGAVILLLMWFYITAFIILLSGELNAEVEHQTKMDTTSDEPEPMGQREAFVADTVGQRH